MSPSYFQAATPPSKKCECILKSRYDNRIMAQYVHTDLHESGNLTCTDSSVLFESKLNPNQTELEKRTEVCGRRSLNNYLYRGDLRITFRDSDSSGSRGGFVSKLLGVYSLVLLSDLIPSNLYVEIFRYFEGSKCNSHQNCNNVHILFSSTHWNGYAK